MAFSSNRARERREGGRKRKLALRSGGSRAKSNQQPSACPCPLAHLPRPIATARIAARPMGLASLAALELPCAEASLQWRSATRPRRQGRPAPPLDTRSFTRSGLRARRSGAHLRLALRASSSRSARDHFIAVRDGRPFTTYYYSHARPRRAATRRGALVVKKVWLVRALNRDSPAETVVTLNPSLRQLQRLFFSLHKTPRTLSPTTVHETYRQVSVNGSSGALRRSHARCTND